jgi:hypothetical protein
LDPTLLTSIPYPVYDKVDSHLLPGSLNNSAATEHHLPHPVLPILETGTSQFMVAAVNLAPIRPRFRLLLPRPSSHLHFPMFTDI